MSKFFQSLDYWWFTDEHKPDNDVVSSANVYTATLSKDTEKDWRAIDKLLFGNGGSAGIGPGRRVFGLERRVLLVILVLSPTPCGRSYGEAPSRESVLSGQNPAEAAA